VLWFWGQKGESL